MVKELIPGIDYDPDADPIVFPPLTEEEKSQFLVALERSRELRQRMLAERGGRLWPSSAEEIRQMRDDREEQLG